MDEKEVALQQLEAEVARLRDRCEAEAEIKRQMLDERDEARAAARWFDRRMAVLDEELSDVARERWPWLEKSDEGTHRTRSGDGPVDGDAG